MGMKDSGGREEFETGAQRDTDDGKLRFDLLPPHAHERIVSWLTAGAIKYAPRNWEKGIPCSRHMQSLLRHVHAYRSGEREEDHLAAIAVNAIFLMQTQYWCEQGLLPPELNDLEDGDVPRG